MTPNVRQIYARHIQPLTVAERQQLLALIAEDLAAEW